MFGISLQQLKDQVNVDRDDSTYDDILGDMLAEASEYVLSLTGRTPEWFYGRYGGMPLALRRAVMLMVGDWFAYREGGRPQSLRPAEEAIAPIINRYRCLIPNYEPPCEPES